MPSENTRATTDSRDFSIVWFMPQQGAKGTRNDLCFERKIQMESCTSAALNCAHAN